jgi:Family of unknown function (DUF6131)
MIVLGVVLIILGLVFQSAAPWLFGLGVAVAVIGIVLELLGRVGRPVAGRRYWY